jgi:hypothetical protein
VAANVAADTVDVQHVIDAYHEAVLTHDGSRLAHPLAVRSVFKSAVDAPEHHT